MPYTRDSMITVMRSFVGAVTGDPKHKYIIDTYNGFVSAGRSKGSKYKMTYSDPWCATTISACAILAGCTDIIPTECSCSRMIKLMKEMGIYNGNDNYIGKPADIIFYNWGAKTEAEDNGADGIANHVGLIESYDSSTGKFTVIEGNYNDKCQRRSVKVGWKYIQGFGCPKYTDNEVYHVVIAGENLSKIAKKYGYKSHHDLLPMNPDIKDPNKIFPGQKVRVK